MTKWNRQPGKPLNTSFRMTTVSDPIITRLSQQT